MPRRRARASSTEPRIYRLHQVYDSGALNTFTSVHSHPLHPVLNGNPGQVISRVHVPIHVSDHRMPQGPGRLRLWVRPWGAAGGPSPRVGGWGKKPSPLRWTPRRPLSGDTVCPTPGVAAPRPWASGLQWHHRLSWASGSQTSDRGTVIVGAQSTPRSVNLLVLCLWRALTVKPQTYRAVAPHLSCPLAPGSHESVLCLCACVYSGHFLQMGSHGLQPSASGFFPPALCCHSTHTVACVGPSFLFAAA